MRYLRVRGVIPALALFTFTIVTAANTAALDKPLLEMWEEPSHQLVFERGDTRILDIRVVPGATSEYHYHRYATAYIVIQDAVLLNKVEGKPWPPRVQRSYRPAGGLVDRSDYVANPLNHRVRNVDDRTFHLLAVVSSREAENDGGDENDSGGLLDNAWFTEHRIRVDPGQQSERLLFGNDVVVVQISGGATHIVENGISHSVKTVPGAYSWHESGAEIRLANDGDRTQDLLVLEVKRGFSAPR